MSPNHPLVYEINARCWLRGAAGPAAPLRPLDAAPAGEWDRLRDLGFTHVWLMGVWDTGARGTELNRQAPRLCEAGAGLLGDFQLSDIEGSPFAIRAYEVPAELGGRRGLERFREMLDARGMALILDFVPNHTALDHPWVRARPDWYVSSPEERPGTFRCDTSGGPRWIAHGRDPFFPPWVDTAQLDLRNPEARAAVAGELSRVLEQCDGVRCDLAMLALNDVFERSWKEFPPARPAPEREFWAETVEAVGRTRPEGLLLAEAYWDLEARMLELGFDYTYDKRLYDHLVSRDPVSAARHLRALTPGFISRGAHFLENHDEARVASLLSWAEHQAAALVVLGLPGLRLVHEGQMEGARGRLPVQLARRPAEPVCPETAAWYERVLHAMQTTAVGTGRGEVLLARPAWAGNESWAGFVLVQWQGRAGEYDLVVANLSDHAGQCYAPLSVSGLAERHWRMQDLLGDQVFERRGDDLAREGLYLDLPGHGAQLFQFSPVA